MTLGILIGRADGTLTPSPALGQKAVAEADLGRASAARRSLYDASARNDLGGI